MMSLRKMCQPILTTSEHKDIEDKGQTVTVKELPETPETPEEPKEPEKPSTPDTPSHKTTDSPKTGDSTHIAEFAILLGISAAGLAFTAYKKRRSMKHGN
jgi:heme-binding NEAT domain protein